MEEIKLKSKDAACNLVTNTSLRRTSDGYLAEKIIDLLTDYLCSNVTESLMTIQKTMEKKIILRALQQTRGNQKEAAKILGLKHTTLNTKVRRYEIQVRKIIPLD
jgi:transcriptional regulator with GAF, ATPase, and Fis domain